MSMLFKSFTLLLIVGIALIGCRYDVQSTSGADYVSAYSNAELVGNADIDQRVREVAAVEPTLRFPARIGLARVSGGELTGIPAAEADAWIAVERRLGPEFGTFVPINLLVAEMVGGVPSGHSARNPRLRQVVEKIRLGAARQHLDAVLIYETNALAYGNRNHLAFTDVTIIGAFLIPSGSVHATAFASALLVDVRNGYPYGSAGTVVDDEQIATLAGSRSASEELSRELVTDATLQLIGDVEQMMRAVKQELNRADDAD